MKILIGGAWPYANGPLHIGHIAALLPGDVLARYHRQRGHSVYYVSGSDCHGTPVAIRARQEGKSPAEISDSYHSEFCRCFDALGFSYDRYGKTSSAEHTDFVRDFHAKMYQGGYIYEKSAPQAYCDGCDAVLTDRLVEGLCPSCGKSARGDQCDACGAVLSPEELIEPVCAVCGRQPVFRDTTHLFIAISRLERELTDFLAQRPHSRKNAVAFTRRYIEEGLRDRAVTRDLDWGIDVPRDGYEDKKIYIWAENVLGYLSMSRAVAKERGEDFAQLWGPDSRHYYVHGKDNIPFHTIILPSLLLAHGGDWKLPDHIISSEFLTLEGQKISTSRNWAIWAHDIAGRYDPDSIRYFLIANGPERRDGDFSWREFVNSHNSELLGAYGNLVNRTLAFVNKYLGGAVPHGALDAEIGQKIEEAYVQTASFIEAGHLKDALDGVFALVRLGNKFFDAKAPWITRQTDQDSCRSSIYSCVQLVANLAVLLEAFLPFSSEKVRGWLGIDSVWGVKSVPAGTAIPAPELLFQRLDNSVVENELERLLL